MSIRAFDYSEARQEASAVGRSLCLYIIDMAVFLPLFGVYFLLRGLPRDRVQLASGHALDIVSLERTLGIFREPAWQRAAVGHHDFVQLANFTYIHLHMPLLLLLGFCFLHVDARKHRIIRNTILLSAFIAVPIYIWFPVTPPRLMAPAGHDLGFVDTLEGVRRAKAGIISNWYAAMPSYHFGWIALAVFGVFWCWQSRALRVGAVLFACLMWWAIVVTANHYFLDMLLGVAIVGACLAVTSRFERWAEAHPAGINRVTFRVGELRLPF